nr:uncharacterized protein LOC122271522 [Parasteatoda tepidariorum]
MVKCNFFEACMIYLLSILEPCWEFEIKVFKIIYECREEALSDALPETVDKTYSYLVAACEDHSKFGKFSYCMGGHIQKGEITDASMSDLEKCYGEVEEKYDVGPERPMFRVG